VTGGAGFIGVPTVRALLAREAEVVVMDNFAVGRRESIAALDVEVLEADLRDADAVARARADVVVHLAALHFIPYCAAHPAETIAVNVLGTQHVLDAAGDARVVFASTGDVYRPSERPHAESDPVEATSVYGASKLAGEHLLHARGRDSVVLRFFNAIGPGETNPHVLPEILAQLRAGDVLHLGTTSSQRDYIDVDDIAEVCARAALGEGTGTINVGAGRPASVDDLLELVREITGRPLRVEVDEARMRPVDRPVLAASTERLRAQFPGFEPTPLRDALERTLAADR
jgi:UDP-glucose 4-epimerase